MMSLSMKNGNLHQFSMQLIMTLNVQKYYAVLMVNIWVIITLLICPNNVPLMQYNQQN